MTADASNDRRKLFVLHKLPVPYHDDLFRALHEHPGVQLQVYHLWRGSDRRPWKMPLGTGYPNHYMAPLLGVDWRSVRDAWRERDALFVVGDWAHLPPLAIVAARLLRRAPVAFWVDTPQEHLPRPLWKRIPRKIFLRWLLRRADAVMASGRPARRALTGHLGVPEDRIVDYQFVVDLEWPDRVRADRAAQALARRWRQAIGCERGGTVFLMSGTIDLGKKAQDVGLEAFARACELARQPMGLLVAGAAPASRAHEEATLREAIERRGLSDRVELLGWLEPHEMASAYLAADVLLHPAHYDPFPLAVIEAMAWGLPVVGTRTSGSVEERVRDGVNGFAVEPGDVEAMAAAMAGLADPRRLEQMSREARRTAERWPMQRAIGIFLDLHDRFVRPTCSG